jgi:hypothetical protein
LRYRECTNKKENRKAKEGIKKTPNCKKTRKAVIRAFVAKQNGRLLKIPKETKKPRMHE